MTKRQQIIAYSITALIAGAIILGSLIHTAQPQIISKGTDSFETHTPLDKTFTITSTKKLKGPLVEIGAIIVPLKNGTPQDVVAETIPGSSIKDDTFAYGTLDAPIGKKNQVITITFTAPTTSRENLLGIRYEATNKNTFTSNQKEKNGQLAITVKEKISLWQYAGVVYQQNKEEILGKLIILLLATIVTILASELLWQKSTKLKTQGRFLAIALLVATALWGRLQIAPNLGGVSGGDPYNYLLITKSIVNFENPFANTKRLPGFPLLLTPAFLSTNINDTAYMQGISILSALGIIILLPFTATTLGLSWGTGYTASALLTLQKDFLWTSIRPEPYTFFAFLLLLCITLFFSKSVFKNSCRNEIFSVRGKNAEKGEGVIALLRRVIPYFGPNPGKLQSTRGFKTRSKQKKWTPYAFSIALGYSAMTRQEGFMIALLFGIFALISAKEIYTRNRRNIKDTILHYVKTFGPALLIVLPFFINNTIQFKNPLYTKYFEGERLQIVDSWTSFQDASIASWHVIASLWYPSWDQLASVDMQDSTVLTTAFIATLAWLLLLLIKNKAQKHENILLIIYAGITLILVTNTVITGQEKPLLSLISTGLLLAGILPFIWQTKQRGIAVIILLISQIGIATWFHPFSKHYQQSIPLLMLLLSSAISLPISQTQKNIIGSTSKIIITTLGLWFLLMSPYHLIQDKNIAIDRHNANNALDSVIYRAVQKSRQYQGQHAFDQGYLQAWTYFGQQAHYYPPEQNDTIIEQIAWLEQNNTSTLVRLNDTKLFKEMPENWNLIETYKSEAKDEKILESFVYVKNN